MMKKLFLGISVFAVAIATVPMFAAFEAHVINVTATIENALQVDTTPIDFGTVFPQEQLDKFVNIALSQSFLDETRVDDVEYMIRQKPKCGLPDGNGGYSAYGKVTEDEEGNFICVDQGYVMLPLLCPYLSKHEITEDGTSDENDGLGIPAFHGDITTWTVNSAVTTQVTGRLAKSEQDIDDSWDIDLKTPCFEGACAQDWESYVLGINPTADPAKYIQPKDNEHMIFGCDLWIEVNGISLPGFGCKNADLMLVMDRSGSIDSDELADMKNAAHAFVTALNPTTAGTHMGQSSFSTTGSLDLHLTDDKPSIDAAIDALSNGGLTNLKEGIELADGELASHPHERDLIPDFMVILTDGNPNVPGSTEAEARAFATTAANNAKANGVEIFVVGIGNDVDETYLKSIASGADHYFASADFTTLQAELEKLAECNE